MAGSMTPQLSGTIGYEQPINPGAGGLGVASSVATLFAKSFTTPKEPTENEKLDDAWDSFRQQLPEGRRDISIGDATMGERNAFGKLYPSLLGKVTQIAEAARSPSATMPQITDDAVTTYVKTPQGMVDLNNALSLYPDAPDKQMAYLLEKAAKAGAIAAEKDALALAAANREDDEGIRKEAWTTVGSEELAYYAATANDAVTDIVDWLMLNPGKSFNVGDVPGLAALLQGIDTINADNVVLVMGRLENSILTTYREQLSAELGFDVGMPPKEVVDAVFLDARATCRQG